MASILINKPSTLDPAFTGIWVRRRGGQPAQESTANARRTEPAVPMMVVAVVVAVVMPVLRRGGLASCHRKSQGASADNAGHACFSLVDHLTGFHLRRLPQTWKTHVRSGLWLFVSGSSAHYAAGHFCFDVDERSFSAPLWCDHRRRISGPNPGGTVDSSLVLLPHQASWLNSATDNTWIDRREL
ncbi:MAG: hypothetical protein K2Y27_24100 [Xanthobacteraceae bacterium]|nr:hypothetical protein [Xanthobacteraceae bacterium]